MNHEQYLQQGELQECLNSIQDNIRADASDVKSRIFLFQLLAVLGSWDRATKQLDVIANMDDSALAMVHVYRAAIECERFREEVFVGNNAPVFMGEPKEWQALMVQALKLTVEAKDDASQELRLKALDLAPSISGSINGEPFEWIADADSRIGPMLEVFVDGQYMWVPFSNMLRLEIEEPEDLRDVVWMPAHIQWQTEGESFVLIPTRYSFSAKQDDDSALSRKTEWDQKGEDCYIGFGQRLLVTDANDYPVMDIREMHFDVNNA